MEVMVPYLGFCRFTIFNIYYLGNLKLGKLGKLILEFQLMAGISVNGWNLGGAEYQGMAGISGNKKGVHNI